MDVRKIAMSCQEESKTKIRIDLSITIEILNLSVIAYRNDKEVCVTRTIFDKNMYVQGNTKLQGRSGRRYKSNSVKYGWIYTHYKKVVVWVPQLAMTECTPILEL